MVFQIVEKPVEIFLPDLGFSSRNQYLSNETKIIVLAFVERLACEMRLFHLFFLHKFIHFSLHQFWNSKRFFFPFYSFLKFLFFYLTRMFMFKTRLPIIPIIHYIDIQASQRTV